MKKSSQPSLLNNSEQKAALPCDHIPIRPGNFVADRIFLAKGSMTTPERVRFVERICALYPEAQLVECPDTPHNRIDLREQDNLARHQKGKHTLVFGEHKSAVRFSAEEGNACPNYWHFSPYGFCFYGCKYCYLAGTPSYWHSPAVRIFLNLEEILERIERVANQANMPTAFYLGKLQDGLALDPLTGFSGVQVPFFAQHKFARQVILTKTGQVEQLLKLDHNQHTILSWSLNPPELSERFEENVPTIAERLEAMKQCAEHGYPVRAIIMPLIPVKGWEKIYGGFVERLLESVPIQRLTLGGICIYQNAKALMEMKLGKGNNISQSLDPRSKIGDGRIRYAQPLRLEMYGHIVRTARKLRPDLELALCLEETKAWKELGIEDRMGHCNCLL